MSGIAGAQYRAAQGMGEAGARIMPQLQGMKRQSMMDYYGLSNQFGMGNQQAKQQYLGSFSSDLGYMTQMALLSQAGFFDNPESAAKTTLFAQEGVRLMYQNTQTEQFWHPIMALWI